MNGELEKSFLEEIKILIEDYETYTSQTLPDYSSIIINTDREYSNDEEGKILQDLDEQLAKLVNTRIDALKQVRQEKTQEKQEAIYSKVKEFLDTSKKEMTAQVGERESKLVKLVEDNEKSINRMKDINSRLDKLTAGSNLLKGVDEKVYNAINEAEVKNINERKKESKLQNDIKRLSEKFNNEIRQLKRTQTELEKTYGTIDFESEKGIETLRNIIKERQEKDLSNEPKSDEQIINTPRIHEAADDIKVASIDELEKRRQGEESGMEQDEDQETEQTQTKFPRLSPDEVEVEEPEKILTVEEAKRKAEEEKMWEEYRKRDKKIEEKRVAKEVEKYEKKEEQIRKDKEELFKSKEEGYQDLLESDSTYQALKGRLINRYSLDQLEKALEGKSLIDIYSLYVKQVNKNLDNNPTIKANLTEEELNGKIEKTLENEELKRKLSLRLEMLRERQISVEEIKAQQTPQEKTKIIIEPYKDTITVYLKGQKVPFVSNHILERIKDGKNFIKSGRMNKGLIKGTKKGDPAIISVLQEIEAISGYDFTEGYTWAFDENPNVASNIDSIVYDFTNEDSKKQRHKMIRRMQKYAMNAEEYGVAESIGRKKGIIEKGTKGIGRLFGKGTEKVLALGEGIKNFHPIGDAMENRRAKKYSKDREVDISKSSRTYNEWRAKMDKSYEDWKKMLRENSPTQEAQSNLAKIFMDKSAQETESEKAHQEKQDEFYDSFGN